MEVAEIQGEAGHTVLLGKSQGVSRVVLFSGDTSLWIIFIFFLNCIYSFVFLFFGHALMGCGILVLHPGIEPVPSTWGA